MIQDADPVPEVAREVARRPGHRTILECRFRRHAERVDGIHALGATFGFLDATYCVADSLGPQTEIYGSEGAIAVHRQGPEVTLHLYQAKTREWRQVEVPVAPPVRDLGVLHVVECLLEGKELVLTGEHGRHLVEVMIKAPLAAQEGRTLAMETTF